jgi:hypothetical protein
MHPQISKFADHNPDHYRFVRTYVSGDDMSDCIDIGALFAAPTRRRKRVRVFHLLMLLGFVAGCVAGSVF